MRAGRWILAAMMCSSLAIPSWAADGPGEVGEAFIEAFKAEDGAAIGELYADDAVSYALDTMVVRGRDAIQKSWEAFFEQFDVVDLTFSDDHYETCGDLSSAWGTFRVVAVPAGGGDEITMEGRFTDVSKKIDGQWRYIMDHASLAPPAE